MFSTAIRNTAFVALSVAVSAVSAQQYVYPAKGQSPQKQKSDEAACYQWAVQQSGFDPAKPPPAPPAQPAVQPGTRLRGAAAGATVGAITGNDRSDAAAAGAVGAASAQRGQKRQQERAQQSQTSQQQASFQKARGVCLEGRGYTVK